MPELDIAQFSTVYNMLSFATAAMFGSFAFFVMARQHVAEKYRMAVLISSIVVFVAGYHYFRIFQSWDHAYALVDGKYLPTGIPFNDAYRYVDWLITVPLLLVELVAVLNLPKEESRSLLSRLVIAAILMIGLGYPGEVATNPGSQILYFILSFIPFVYILRTLWVELGVTLTETEQSEEVQNLVNLARNVILVTWSFYPIAYIANIFAPYMGGDAEVFVQVGYSIADVTAKCGYGVVIFLIAKAKTDAEGGVGATATA